MVLKVIQKDQLTVKGLPWQTPGDIRKIGLQELVAKCLCDFHNAALSPLDTAAGQFFDFIEKADMNRSIPGLSMLVSGHDIERWLLKTLYGAANSKNLARGGKSLPPNFHSSINVVRLLEDPNAWPPGTGIYFIQNVGDIVTRGDEFGMAPLTLPVTNEFSGLRFSVQGLVFDLLIIPPDLTPGGGAGGLYRPDRLSFLYPEYRNQILISWADNKPHGHVDLKFEMTVQDYRRDSGLPDLPSPFR